MIMTIGSLVQETSSRLRWRISATLYIVSMICASLLTGALLGSIGLLLRNVGCKVATCGAQSGGIGVMVLGGLIALAYAASDLGFLFMPRPFVMYAVPVTWWRRWRPYGAALAYGSALGLGITTRVPYGAFYLLWAWCILQANPLYGALVVGVYGLSRAMALLPTSKHIYNTCPTSAESFDRILAAASWVRPYITGMLIAFGVQTLLVAFVV